MKREIGLFNKQFILISLALCIIAIFWVIQSHNRIAISQGNTLTICLGQEPDTLYPFGGSMLVMQSVLEAVYDGPIDANAFDYQAIILEKVPSLADGDAIIQQVTVSQGDTVVDADSNVIALQPGVFVVPSGQTEPILYNGGNLIMDQLVVNFTLKSKLTWSDRHPLTAYDSVYAFNLQAEPDTPVNKYTIERTKSYQALDDRSVEWTGLPGFRDITYQTNFFGPAPEHVWGQYPAADLLVAEISSKKPLGWGAYIIDEWIRGEYISLHKNPYYFRANEGLPKYSGLIYRFVGEDANFNITALLTSECDIVDQTGGVEDQMEMLLELDRQGLVRAAIVPGPVWEHIDFGIQHIDYDNGYSMITDRPNFFSDVRVRRAFAMCMDRQAVVDTALYGQSIVLDTYLPPQHPLFVSPVAHYDYNVAAGSALLDEVGWKDTDGDPTTPRVAFGVTNVPDGTPLTVAYETTDAILRQQVTAIIQQSLAECGINAEIVLYPASEWFADGPDGKLFGRRFDLGEFAWLTAAEPPCDLYLTSDVPGPPDGTWVSIMNPSAGNLAFPLGWGGSNDPGFSYPAYDNACDMGLNALPGQLAFEVGHKEAQKLFAESLPVVPLFLRLKVAATRPELTGFVMDATAKSEMWNIEEFSEGVASIGNSIFMPLMLGNWTPLLWEVEPNDTVDQANGPLVSGVNYYGFPDDQRDYFSVYLSKTGTVTVDLTHHLGQGVQLQLFHQSTDKRVAYVSKEPYHLEYDGQPGWYYIYIFTESGFNTVTPFTLRVMYP